MDISSFSMNAPHVAASPYDTSAMLAMSMHAGPGVYALLVGSGISYGSGVATGWGVVQELVRRMASTGTNDGQLPDGFDVEQWWGEAFSGVEIGYDTVLEACTMTPTERRRFLEPFFVPTEEELSAGKKIPARSHRAIARLVKRGSVRVIVTTNFDDLIEKALDEVGVPYQVVASPGDIEGVDALRHSACTIIKVHGDYRRIDLLNTKEELASYRSEINKLLDSIFDEYGLITCGWSADWDEALVEAINRAPSRRYPLYWATRDDLGNNAQRLVQQRRGAVVTITDADTFFTELADRLDVLDRMANPPLTVDLAIGQLKRYLPDPVRRLDLRDLFEGEIRRVRDVLSQRSLVRERGPAVVDGVHVLKAESDRLASSVDLLARLIAQGIILDTHREHDDLWIWIIEQLMRACRQPKSGEASNDGWKNLGYLPAWLTLQAASYAAVQGKRDDLLIRLFLEATCHDRGICGADGRELPEAPAVSVLYDYRLFGEMSAELSPNTNDKCQIRKYTRRTVLPMLEPLLGNTAAFKALAERVDYRVALIQQHTGRPGQIWAPVLEYLSHVEAFRDTWTIADDFNIHADAQTWINGLELASTDALEKLQTELETIARERRWF